MTTLGNFPTGGALTPDGRRYWAVDSGLGHNDVKIVDVTSGAVVQTLPLPGAYGGVAFNADGTRACVSGEPLGDVPADGKTTGDEGDVLHVFQVDPDGGRASELDPIAPDAALSAALPFDHIDAVPEEILDRILWHSVHGANSTPPAPGPNASPAEHARAVVAMHLLRTGGDARAWLLRHGDAGELDLDG
jgi:hypothetical protein